jgi:hypothetical protein
MSDNIPRNVLCSVAEATDTKSSKCKKIMENAQNELIHLTPYPVPLVACRMPLVLIKQCESYINI